jgi:hypothetical protein
MGISNGQWKVRKRIGTGIGGRTWGKKTDKEFNVGSRWAKQPVESFEEMGTN